MPPRRGSINGLNPAVLRVRWQHRTVAILYDTSSNGTQSIIQQAAEHFRLGAIIDELILVGRIDGEELELTTSALCLLSEGATVTLTHIPSSVSGRKEGPTRSHPSRTFIDDRKFTIHFAAIFRHHPYTMSFRVRPTCMAGKVIAAVAHHLDIEEAHLRRALDHIHPNLSLRDNGIQDGDIIDFQFD